MANQRDVGEVYNSSDGIHWIIRNFNDFISNYKIESPMFNFVNGVWRMTLTKKEIHINSSRSIWMEMGAYTTNNDIRCRTFTFAIIGEPQGNFVKHEAKYTEGNGLLYYACFPLHLDHLMTIKVPEGKLHVFFGKDNETCDSSTRSSTQFETEGIVKLKQDFKNILNSGSFSDVVLRTQGEEFKAHRCVLAARSPVLLAMMTHDAKEKNTSIVDIPDADPNTVPVILNYFYTGSVENNLTSENALNIYAFADKYQMGELKDSCLRHMLTNISVDGFCDVFSLSLLHDERVLKEACIQFFAENSLDIISTFKWQTFLSDNPIIGNELFMKYIKLNKLR